MDHVSYGTDWDIKRMSKDKIAEMSSGVGVRHSLPGMEKLKYKGIASE